MSLQVKRAIDIAVAAGLLLVLSPLVVATFIAIFIRLGRPVIFRQQRPGHKGRPFYVYKFRTMMRATEVNGRQLADGERMGRLGKLLRRTSLDELPQLWNVLKGDMSLVGPRPLLMRYLPYFTAEEMQRFSVRPGITGWAQIRGRNSSTWDNRLAADVWYVEHWSLSLDVRILLITAARVVRREGVANDPGAQMRDLDIERKTMSECRG